MATDDFNWSKLSKYRKEIDTGVRALPVIHQRNALDHLRRALPQQGSVLEIGAHDRRLETELESLDLDYRSMDVDASYDHDFYSVDELTGTYGAIVMIDVVEHLSIQEFIQYLEQIDKCIRDEGVLIIQLPNIFALGSNQFYDVMHKQHWPFYDLYALLRYHGFRDIDMYRLDNLLDLQEKPSWKRILRKWFRQFFVRWFGNGLDFAPNILTIARK